MKAQTRIPRNQSFVTDSQAAPVWIRYQRHEGQDERLDAGQDDDRSFLPLATASATGWLRMIWSDVEAPHAAQDLGRAARSRARARTTMTASLFFIGLSSSVQRRRPPSEPPLARRDALGRCSR